MRIIQTLRNLFFSKGIATTGNTAVVLSIFALLAVAPSYCCTEDPSVKLVNLKARDGIDVCIQPYSALDATLTIDLKLENLVSTSGNDFTCDLHNYRQRSVPYNLTHLRVIDFNKDYTYHYDFHYRIGNLFGRPDPNFVYELPYQRNEHHRINQGYFGTFSHQLGSDTEYALDFRHADWHHCLRCTRRCVRCCARRLNKRWHRPHLQNLRQSHRNTP